jgi:hypothetical protein
MLAELLRYREAGFDAQRMSDNEIVINTETAALGADAVKDRQDKRTTAFAKDMKQSIALDYAKTRLDGSDLSAVASRLRATPAFKGVAQEYIEERLQEIAARGENITYATAGEIMRNSIQQRANKGTLGRAWENLSRAANVVTFGGMGTNERDIGGDRVIEQDKVDQYVNEINSGVADKNISLAQTRQRANGALQAQKAIVDQAAMRVSNTMQAAQAGNPTAAQLLPKLQRRLESVQGQLEAMLRQPD